MPYTLMKGLLWVLLAVVLGIVIGWFLRSVAAHRQVRQARAERTDLAEVERLRARIAELEPAVADRDRLIAELEAAGPSGDQAVADPVTAAAPPVSNPNDVGAASEVLGRSIAVDDLTVVEGIGPEVEGLCHGIGIRTWLDLATTEVSLLRTMLADAGSGDLGHDPSTWPEQAALLASGRWAEFKALTDALSGGRAAD